LNFNNFLIAAVFDQPQKDLSKTLTNYHTLKPIMLRRILLIFLLSHLISIGTSINIEATHRFARESGIMGPTISAQEEIGKDPEQYFLCGFAFR
jgi:hypothetical protein